MEAKTLTSKMQTYKIWAPDNALWTEWAKPVLFAGVPDGAIFPDAAFEDITQIGWLTERNYNAIIVVDLPGKQGVEEGLGLARLGYRPVPLYNGVIGPQMHSANNTMLVNVFDIAEALYASTEALRVLPIRPTAPPAFLLDSDRMAGGTKAQPGWYDNRWCVFPEDMPSAAFLSGHKIQEVIVRAAAIQDDLAHVLRRYQERGIKISLCDGVEIREINVQKPSRFKSLFYRLGVILGLTRNAAGGFGGLVPIPQSGGHHRIG